MSTGSTMNINQKKSLLHRGYTAVGSISTTQYLPPSQFKLGILNGTPNNSSTDLDLVIPIEDGTTNDDGSNTLTGSGGGDNTTDNTVTYKEGAGNTDDTAQNLIKNDTAATAIWTIANLAAAGTIMTATQPAASWLYILDSTTLGKLLTSGTAIELKWGSDAANYYSKTWEAEDLSVGWNWLNTAGAAINTLTETGAVAGDIDTFIIEITTNNATNTFIAGDVVYDLLRQWATSDTLKNFVTSYPSINLSTLEVTSRSYISSIQANGFNINAHAPFNADTTPLMMAEDVIDAESKSRTDEIAFVGVDRLL